MTESTPDAGGIFVSYRRDDAAYPAGWLVDRLVGRFGADRVFQDVGSIQPGDDFVQDIMAAVGSCAVLLAVIGAKWLTVTGVDGRRRIDDPGDYVRLEIEEALARNVRVVPVLVDSARMPGVADLPASLQGLAHRQALVLSPANFDTSRLLAVLESTLTGTAPAGATDDLDTLEKGPAKPAAGQDMPSGTRGIRPARQPGTPTQGSGDDRVARHGHYADPLATGPDVPDKVNASAEGVAPAPGTDHFELVFQKMVDEGSLVPLLGPRLAGGYVAPPDDSGAPISTKELASDLAERFGLKSTLDLAEVAHDIYLAKGGQELYRTLKRILVARTQPGPVHRFLARFPRMLEERRLGKRYQLIVSTNFDMALEQAFDDEEEPYDLAVYMASGPDKGKFVHFPWDGDPEPIVIPNSYMKFPVGDDGGLERTVIVKAHGTVDGKVGRYRWKENYVITDDQYIDYLSRGLIENLIPVQILDKLRNSNCLFLGYPVRDWKQRVFVSRVWGGGRLGAESWAIEPDPDMLEKQYWAQSDVGLYAAGLAPYADRLTEQLAARRVSPRAVTAVQAVPDTPQPDTPYVGLDYYAQKDAAMFFGRDTERAMLISNLRVSRLTVLYAQTLAGKTSLLRAGVASRLEELARRSLQQQRSARYIPVIFNSWRDDPTDELIGEIRRTIISFAPGPLPDEFPHERLEDVTEAASRVADATLLVMLDQFEEYFLYSSRETRDKRFADELAACINRSDLRANFLISIREDTYSALGDLFKGRITDVYGNHLHLEYLNRQSARMVMEKSIVRFNELRGHEPPFGIEHNLVDAVLDQLGRAQFPGDRGGMAGFSDGKGMWGNASGIPYLQLVMATLYESERAQGSRRLRLKTLEELGGTQAIVQAPIDKALSRLTSNDRKAAVDILIHMITPSGTKVAITASDLAMYTGLSVSETSDVLRQLTDTRIVRPVPAPPGQDPIYVIFHDVLAPAIVDWTRRLRADQRKRRR